MSGMDRLYSGQYNHIIQEWQEDGSCIVTLHSVGDAEAVTMHIDEMWGPKEELLIETVVPVGPHDHILARIAGAVSTPTLVADGTLE